MFPFTFSVMLLGFGSVPIHIYCHVGGAWISSHSHLVSCWWGLDLFPFAFTDNLALLLGTVNEERARGKLFASM